VDQLLITSNVFPTFPTSNFPFARVYIYHSILDGAYLLPTQSHNNRAVTPNFQNLNHHSTHQSLTYLFSSIPLLTPLLITHPPHQCSQPQRRQRHIPIYANIHRLRMMAVPDPVRVSAIPSRNVVEHRGHDGEFGVRFRCCLRC
jgi:hypothetical protein